MINSKSHCIVTPDFIGPIKNGGIGTACFHLAKYISTELGLRVTILFTGPIIHGSAAEWRRHYSESQGWEFLCLEEVAPPKKPLSFYNSTPWFLERSYRIDRWLRDQHFDSVHFQDWQGNGFCSVQAKAQGIAHLGSFITCTVHSPQAWIDEGSRSFGSSGTEGMLQHYNERYAACLADLTVFPSMHMQRWAQARSWCPRDERVIQYIFESIAGPQQRGSEAVSELCFFGRLETRKGLELFVGAIERLQQDNKTGGIPPLTFLGKVGVSGGKSADRYLMDFSRQAGVPIKLLTDLDSDEALKYLAAERGRVAVVASLLDNLPLTVIECLNRGVKLLAARTGGIPELVVSEQHLFEPHPASLAAKLADALVGGLEPVRSGYSSAAAKDGWGLISQMTASKVPSRTVEAGDITICVAYYNYGKYLPLLLSSLAAQTAPGFSVVVVNDGSTDQHSKEVFTKMREQYAIYDSWVFLEQANAGIGATRNVAASQAKTDYIVFMDADNEAKPEMVEKMARSMSYSSADCLTCYMEGFEENADTANRKVVYEYFPTGGCIDAGLFMNVFGDANFIAKRSVFNQLDGFTTDRTASFEDWEFLARLLLKGYSLDVIPETLFSYRHTEHGFSRTTSAYLNHRRVMDTYTAHLPAWADGIVRASYKLLVPRSDDHPPATTLSRLIHRARTTLRYLPPGAQTLAKKAYQRIKTPLLG